MKCKNKLCCFNPFCNGLKKTTNTETKDKEQKSCGLRESFERIDTFMEENTTPMVRDYWIQEMKSL